jgi:uncharacterized protein (DUF1501 family)
MNRKFLKDRGLTRRDLMRAGLATGAAGLAGALPLPRVFGGVRDAAAATPDDKRILVVFEMSGGNDGLNTVVPYGDDAYYQARPAIGIPADEVLAIDEHFGFNPGVVGFERLYKDGKMAIVHGCGYDNPSFSHFTSMAYWHTAAPNSGEAYGWVGRTADAMMPGGAENYLINIDATQSLAVQSRDHVPVVFDNPANFVRDGFMQEKELLAHVPSANDGNPSRRYLEQIAQSALDASALVREAWANYDTPVDYGLVPLDLDKIASLIAADMPTRLYYTSFRNNAFDTHVHQGNLHRRLLTYAADAVLGFIRDMERIGRADDVTVLIFSEFGRRVPENTSLGTDHGAANNMFVVGKPVKGGHYGDISSLTTLDEGDNLLPTTDFRRVYATIIENWLGVADASTVLHGEFEPFDMFG